MTDPTQTPNEEGKPVPVMVEPAFNIEVPSNNPGGIEREVFGKWTVMLRNLTGTLAVLTTCIAALMNAWSVNHSVTAGQGWPDMMIMLIMNVGPIICAWTWINANKTLSTLLEGTSLTTKIRGKMAEIIAPPSHPVNRPETPPPAPPPPPAYGRLDYPEDNTVPEAPPRRPE
jgi:hypothetical protein